jgi:glycosyltransferase involved in cell wall biosynthesis
MSAMSEISVIIALRDRSGTRLANCLRSLRWQTVDCADVEIVLSDFGSDLQHAASIAEMADEYGAVVERTETDAVWNRSRALNLGIQAATGRLALCTDADMIFAPDFLAAVLQSHASEPDAMVVCRCHDLPESLAETPWQRSDFALLRSKAAERHLSGTGACQAVRRQFFNDVRGYDEAFEYWGAEDDDMLHRAQRYGLQVCWLPKSTSMLHQWHPTMKNDKWLQRKINEWRLKLTRHNVVKNRAGWGHIGAAD